MSEIFTCSRCREEHPITARTFFEGETLCPDCLEENTVWQNNMCKHYSAENRYRIKKCLNLLEYKSFQHNICMRSTKCEYRYYAGKC